MGLGGMNDVHEANPDGDDSTPIRRRSHSKSITEQNLVLLIGWIKFGTNSIVGRNQKGDSYWDKIAEYCDEHCSFDIPRDGSSCRNHYNYVDKSVGKWVGAYDNVKRMQQSGWSEEDVLAKANELYSNASNGNFKYMKEWLALRDQPRYGSQVGGNTCSGSGGSKRAHEYSASDSNFIGSSARPMGRDAAKKNVKKKGKSAALETLTEEIVIFKECKTKELERLDKILKSQEEATQVKKMEMFMKLNEKEYFDDRSKMLLQKLTKDLFGN